MRRLLDALRKLFRTPPATPPDYVDSKDCGLVDAVQSGWFQNDTGELLKGFAITPDDIVVDVGCGAGGATLFCARQGAQITFTDTDPEKIQALTQQLARMQLTRATGMVSDSAPLPLPDEYATRVVALEVLEHVAEPESILKELVRIGKPGALYLIAVPDAVGEHIQKKLAPPQHFEAPNHIHIFERETLKEMVTAAGLIIETVHFYSFYWCMWTLLYWAEAEASGTKFTVATHDAIAAPYPKLLNDWAKLWYQLINLPSGPLIRQEMDKVMPKSQIIIARKPSESR